MNKVKTLFPAIHTDPMRYPKLQEPIENSMLNMFGEVMNKIIVDVTKIMVNQANGNNAKTNSQASNLHNR